MVRIPHEHINYLKPRILNYSVDRNTTQQRLFPQDVEDNDDDDVESRSCLTDT